MIAIVQVGDAGGSDSSSGTEIELAGCGYSILEPKVTVLVDRLDVEMK